MRKNDKDCSCYSGKEFHHHGHCSRGSDSSAIYAMGIFGALFYFLQGASTFGGVVVGIVKAIFWPAILMFKIFTALQI